MISFRACSVGVLFFSVLHAATPQERIAGQVPAAMKRLEAWEKTNPEPGERRIHIVYWTPSDRDPAPDYEKRLGTIFLEVQKFYSGEMKRMGFGPRTIQLDPGPSGLPKVYLVKGKNPYSHYKTESGHEIRKECVPALKDQGLDADKETIVMFCNMSNWDAATGKISQNSPYYAIGDFRRGNAWQVDSPILNLDSLAKKEPMVTDGQYGRISIGRYNSIFIGGIIHELGHALGLPHNRQTPAEYAAFGTALMGSGNRTYGENLRGEGPGTFITLAHGLKLASHPSFSGSVKGFDKEFGATLGSISIEENDKGFLFKGTIKGTPEVYAVLGYMDPDGGNDYDATTCTAVPDADGNFTLEADAFAPGKNGEFAVVAVAVNGSASSFGPNDAKWKYPYKVSREGKVDVSAIKNSLATAPWYEAIRKGTAFPARETLSVSVKSSPILMDVYRRLEAKASGGAIKEEGGRLPLSALPWKSAATGYGPASADVLADANPMFRAAGRVFAGGLYAHAPSRYVFDLDGKWKRLTGDAGLPEGKDGTVTFRILGDGKVLWQSATIKENGSTAFDVSLEGVKTLVLESGDAGNGNRSDWGLWLDPQLLR